MPTNNKLVCLGCGSPRDAGIRRCRPCNLLHKRELSARRYKNNADEINSKRKIEKVCSVCKSKYYVYRKNSILCKTCLSEARRLGMFPINSYEYGTDYYCWEHKKIAEECLGRRLLLIECVHHVDWNPTNNNQINLFVLNRSAHSALHFNLALFRFISEKTDPGFSWESVSRSATIEYLKNKNIPFIDLSGLPRSKKYIDTHRYVLSNNRNRKR